MLRAARDSARGGITRRGGGATRCGGRALGDAGAPGSGESSGVAEPPAADAGALWALLFPCGIRAVR